MNVDGPRRVPELKDIQKQHGLKMLDNRSIADLFTS
ncbi:hypothetical protein ACEQPO_17920 [Bacillus sp. SL00103]